MPRPYSQSRAFWAITRASFKAIFTNPSAIFFSVLFPIIFILIFGAFGNEGAVSYRIVIKPGSDTNNVFYQSLRSVPVIRIADLTDSAAIQKELQRGRLTAVLELRETRDSAGRPHYTVITRSTTASSNSFFTFQYQVLDYLKLRFESDISGRRDEMVTIAAPVIEEVRKYRSIDFVLPGQLGFSILFATLFGIAFTFFTLREQLVLKRFYASPVNRMSILLGIGMSRLFFQLINVIVLIGFGYFFLNFTLQHGVATFFDMLVMTVIMLFLLMGVGLIFSSIAKSDSSIPLLINLFGFPQMMLSGTFFPIEVFPKWLQEICRVLPLTQYNDAVRKISFEGLGLLDCWKEIGILGIWIAITYGILGRVIKWE
jgi:ABC-2 type transport system permease protein